VGSESNSIPRMISTTHSLHLPCVTQDVGTRTPACSAAVKSETPGGTSIRCPLTVRVTGIGDELPACGAFELELYRTRDVLGGAWPLLRFAPSPLRQVIVRTLKPTLAGELIDSFH